MERCCACAGILDEKAAATQALGLYAKATLELYGPYVERTLSILQRMASYFHDDVREQAYDSLAYLVAATAKAFPISAPGVRSHPNGHNVHCVTTSVRTQSLVLELLTTWGTMPCLVHRATLATLGMLHRHGITVPALA